MKNTIKLSGLALLFAFGPVAGFQAFAQTGGKLDNTEIKIEKSKVLELPEASRNYEKFRIEPPEKKTNTVTYRFNDYKLPDQDVPLSARVLTIKQEDLKKLYGNYIKAGFGNYSTPYLKGYFHNKRSDRASFGGYVSHVSSNGPVDNSDVSNSEIGAHGESYMGNITVGGRVGYERDGYKFYGYNPDLPSPDIIRKIDQNFNRVNGEAYINNKTQANSKMQYGVKAGVKYFSDAFDASEVNGYGGLDLQYFLSNKSRVEVLSDLSFISYKDGDDISRPYFKIAPSYQVDLDKLDVSVGAILGYTGDTINNGDKLNFYPNLRLGYEAIENKLVLFAGATGDLQRVTLYDLTRENPWLKETPSLMPELASNRLLISDTDKQLELYGGVTGSLIPNVQITARVAYQNYKNLYFFNHNPLDSARFILEYDPENTNALNFYGEVVYNKAEKFRLGVKTDYYNWSTGKLEHPFYLPANRTTVFGSYNIYDKILFNAELYYIGSSFGKIYRGLGEQVIVESDNIVDLNLKVDYRISEKFSTFVMLNNILGKKYERFVNYPTKGFNAIVGLSYTF
ncbi:TonB-dependent receptor [Adhaeribacter soli]|uniref:TonB-dependent receptor n=1 Tax=Adhaeribacter soli TaxID=2607655 RepID=A0A5N1IP29_9BACT|nr:hypothetical protein [Adhaeribacter soli]KAA9325240.1 hypothetical protein F0P94_18635 [Adhaeribacter soli]